MRRSFLLIAGLATMFCLNATEVVSTAGNLNTLISDPAQETSLTVTGTIDASDFYFINEEMTSLTSLDLSNATIEAYSGDALYGNASFNANEIPYGAFVGSSVSSIILPTSGNIVINQGAFAGSDIQSITIGGNVTLSEYAFSNCKSLTEVTFSQKIEIPASAFEHCTSLTTVNGSDYITYIGDNAFNNCPVLKSFSFGKELTAIGNEAFQNSGLTSANLSACSALVTIGDWSFASCSDLTTVILPETIKSIGVGAFFGDSSLEIATLPSTVTEISDFAFTGDSALDLDRLWHNGVESIGQFALADNDKVQYITLPSGLTYIGDNAFEDQTSLVSINAHTLTSVPELGSTVWEGVEQNNVELKVMDTLASDFKAAAQWKEFNISITTTTGNNILNDNSNAINAYFDNRTLHIVSANCDIADVRVYDIASRQYAVVAPNSSSVTIDASAWNDNIYIVYVALTDGTQSTIKLVRK